MKTYIFIFCFWGIGLNMYSQSTLSIIGGIDLSKISNFDSISIEETNLELLEKGFSIESPYVGLKLKKALTKSFGLSISTNYTHKRINATNLRGIASPNAISFNYLRNNAAINYKLDKYNLGLAGCYNFINNLKYIYSNGVKGKFNTSANEFGIKMMASYELKKIELGINYYRGLNSIKDDKGKLYWKPIESIEIEMMYNLQL